jgi:hypothetical protein
MRHMEPARFASQIEKLRAAGWSCLWKKEEHTPTLDATEGPLAGPRARYPWLPEAYLTFVRDLEVCANAAETRWILAPGDYLPGQDHAFTHDEWERLSLEACDDDEALAAQVRQFWDGHFPFCMDVSDSYAYHAIRVADGSGVIVHGREPEFEEVEIVAESFEAFLAMLPGLD